MAGTKGGHRGRGDLPQMGVLGMFPMGDPTWSMCEGSELGGSALGSKALMERRSQVTQPLQQPEGAWKELCLLPQLELE